MSRRKVYRLPECKGGDCMSGFPVVCANYWRAPVAAAEVCGRCWHLKVCHEVSK